MWSKCSVIFSVVELGFGETVVVLSKSSVIFSEAELGFGEIVVVWSTCSVIFSVVEVDFDGTVVVSSKWSVIVLVVELGFGEIVVGAEGPFIISLSNVIFTGALVLQLKFEHTPYANPSVAFSSGYAQSVPSL